MLIDFIIFILFVFQFILGNIFTSDIPMKVSADEIIFVIFISIIIFIMYLKKKKHYINLLIMSMIFFIIWIVDTVNLTKVILPVTYSINIICLISTFSCLIFTIYKIKRFKSIYNK